MLKKIVLCLMFVMIGVSCYSSNSIGDGQSTTWINPSYLNSTLTIDPALSGVVAAYRCGNWHVTASNTIDIWYDSYGQYNGVQSTALDQPSIGPNGGALFLSSGGNTKIIFPALLSTRISTYFSIIVRLKHVVDGSYGIFYGMGATDGLSRGGGGQTTRYDYAGINTNLSSTILPSAGSIGIFATSFEFGSNKQCYQWSKNTEETSTVSVNWIGAAQPPYVGNINSTYALGCEVMDIWIFNTRISTDTVNIFRRLL